MAGSTKMLKALVAEAKKRGATTAKVIASKDIVVDERVRLKCSVPLCDNYGRHLLCPPNVMPVEQFRKVVKAYHHALLLQVEADSDSRDRTTRHLDADLVDALKADPGIKGSERELARIVEEMEAIAFKWGYPLAAGLGGSDCQLCQTCVGQGSGKPCKHPFRARPSMQALGIDVITTCDRAGTPIDFSSGRRIRWTGLVLLD